VSYKNEKQFKTQARNETKRMINVVEAFYHSLSFFLSFCMGAKTCSVTLWEEQKLKC
jgi:hypothetical protein